jgi:uncharacterized protein
MATGLLLLLDDITSILNDVAVLTKVTVSKTAGVVGDDLALNAYQVTGVLPNRELPIVWAVAKGSAVNKAILVPSALALSALAPWAITPLLIVGGSYLCFEGCEKIAHKLLHSHQEDEAHHAQHHEVLATQEVDVVAAEKAKILGAIRTDFILSAEIIVIALGIVEKSTFLTQVFVMVGVGILMTIGVYGLVAIIVKRGITARLGRFLLVSAPYLMKFLTIAGTAAMFFVGGGILVHKVDFLHHGIEYASTIAGQLPGIGLVADNAAELILDGFVGVLVGAMVLIVVKCLAWFWGKAEPKHS